MQGRHSEVDATVKLCLQRNLDLNAVVLGTLMEATAARVDPSQVEPNFLPYAAYAKVHLLSGQPQNAVSIMDELMHEGKGDMDYKLAVDYLQVLLIMCHSSLSSAHMTSLHQFLDKGAASNNGGLWRFCPRNCSRAQKTFASKTCLLHISPIRA